MGIWERQTDLIGSAAQDRLRSSHVLVAGIGANGSVAAEALVRVGVGTLTIADPDCVEVNNLNRQNYVYRDVRRRKTDALAGRLREINPDVSVICIPEGVTSANAEHLVLSSNVVLDACDDYAVKVRISRECVRNNRLCVHTAGGAYRGAVTVFTDEVNYEGLFELPTKGVPDEQLCDLDFTAHRKMVVDRFGAGVFDEEVVGRLKESSSVQWPTLVGACDIAGHLAALQSVWVLLRWRTNLILAPTVLVFDVRRGDFQHRDFSRSEERTFRPGV